jgi:hypothetical protein
MQYTTIVQSTYTPRPCSGSQLACIPSGTHVHCMPIAAPFAVETTHSDYNPRRGALASTHGASIRARFRCSAAASHIRRRFV